jgi:hypothetical protein
LHFDLLSSAVCRKWHVPLGSFSIFPQCFFPALPSLRARRGLPPGYNAALLHLLIGQKIGDFCN